ncbi:MAG TPA: type II toxin-antitoxin system RelE/ParE family toxin [Allosphingosinicella sp.]|jgi:toxin ParE1/3/4
MEIRRLPSAIRDLDDIWFHIALDDEASATRLAERIALSVSRLADYPLSGPARPDIAEDARSLVVGNYLVLYRVSEASVEIVRVLHGAREITRLLWE